jgi:hypothetical protein
MDVSGNLTSGLRYDVAVLAKQQQTTREQGKQALQLIQSATAPQPALPPGVGGQLNIVA